MQSTSLTSGTPLAIAGTLAYMAPEILDGREPNPASDVYAVGIIAFELLFGRRPCGAERPSDVRPNVNRDFDWDWFYSAVCSPLEKRPADAALVSVLVDNIGKTTRLRRREEVSENNWTLIWTFVGIALLAVTIGAGFLNSYAALVIAWSIATSGFVVAVCRRVNISIWKLTSVSIALGIVCAIPFAVIFIVARLVWALVH